MNAKSFNRTDRVADVIQRELAQLIRHEITDPRLQQKRIVISHVTVTRDLAYAKIYVSFHEDDEVEIKQLLKVLKNASGYLRTQLARHIRLRTVPELQFVYDNSLKEGYHIDQVIEQAMNRTLNNQSAESSDDSSKPNKE